MTDTRVEAGRYKRIVPCTRGAASILLLVLIPACAPAVRTQPGPAPVASSQAAVLEGAVRSGQRVRAFLHDGTVAEGRPVALGAQQFRAGTRRFAAADADSIHVRHQVGADWRPVVAGAGIGALGTMFVGILATYAGAPVLRDASHATVLGGGALAGGVLGAMLAARGADVHWARAWPPE